MALRKPLVLNGGQLQRLQTGDYLEISGLFDPTSNLGGINGLATNGITVHNGTSFSTVSLTAPSGGMTITNPTGVGGNPTFAFTDEIADLLSIGTGVVVKDAAGSLVVRTVQGTTDQITVSNGTGVSGNPTIALASNPVIPGNGAVTVPVGTSGERPTGTNGMVRYSTSSGKFEFFEGGNWINYGTSNASGTVTSVDVSLPTSVFSASSGAITTSGTISFTLNSQTANTVFAAPNGASGTPTFRALVEADIPSLNWSKITSTPTTLSGYDITDAVPNTRTITAGTGLTGGGDLSADRTLSLATVGTPIADDFVRVTTDVYGRVTASTPVTDTDITGTLGYVPLNKAGDTMSGQLNMGSNKIISVADPTGAQDAATKAYVDSVAQGLAIKPAVLAATTANLTATYSNGTAGVGATLTSTTNGAFPTIDGVSVWALQDGVLIKNQTNAFENGRYYISDLGSASTPWVLTRCGYCDESTEIPSSFVFVQSGTTQAATGWAALVENPSTFTVGTDDITFTQFSGSGAYQAGAGLNLTGNVFSVGMGAGIVELPTDEVGIDLFSPSGGAIILTEDGTTRSTTNAGQLHLLLNGSTLVQSGSGLSVAAGGITATELATSVAGDGLVGGGGTALSVNVDGSTLEINTDVVRVKDGGITAAKLAAAVAGAGLKNNGTELYIDVGSGALQTTGDVLDIKTAGVTNAMLVNSSVNLAGDTGTGSVALGGTLTLTGGTGIDTSTSGSSTTITLNATLDDLSDVTVTTVTAGDIIYRNAGNTAWINGQPGEDSGVQPYDDTLAALAQLPGTTGMVVESGVDAFVTREIEGTSGNIIVTDGDGVAGNPVINLASGIVTPGTYASVTVDTYGRVTSGTTIESSTQVALTNVNASAIVIGTPVYVHTAGNVDKADAGATSTTRCIGLVADTAIANSASGNIAIAGVLSATTGQWDAITGASGGLTAGAQYYLSDGTAGTLTTTAPTADGSYVAPVGIALSTTQMKIDIGTTIQL